MYFCEARYEIVFVLSARAVEDASCTSAEG